MTRAGQHLEPATSSEPGLEPLDAIRWRVYCSDVEGESLERVKEATCLL